MLGAIFMLHVMGGFWRPSVSSEVRIGRSPPTGIDAQNLMEMKGGCTPAKIFQICFVQLPAPTLIYFYQYTPRKESSS